MIAFSRKGIVLAVAPDSTAPEHFPAQTVMKYDQISYVNNNIILQQGDILPLDALCPNPEPLPKIRLQITTSGGDGRTPPGYNLDEPKPIQVHAELHVKVPNPANPVEQIDIIPPVSGQWRIPFTGTGDLYREITVTAGVADFQMTATQEGGFYPAIEYFDKVSFGDQLYEIEIDGDPRFVCYRVAPSIS